MDRQPVTIIHNDDGSYRFGKLDVSFNRASKSWCAYPPKDGGTRYPMFTADGLDDLFDILHSAHELVGADEEVST